MQTSRCWPIVAAERLPCEVWRSKLIVLSVGPKFAEAVQSWPNPSQFGRKLTDVGRVRTNSGSSSSKFGPTSAKLGAHSDKFGPSSTEVGPSHLGWTEFGAISAKLGQIRGNFTKLGQSFPESTDLGRSNRPMCGNRCSPDRFAGSCEMRRPSSRPRGRQHFKFKAFRRMSSALVGAGWRYG